MGKQDGVEKDYPHFSRLLDLLALERREDEEAFREMVASKPLDERRKEGYTWQPVEVVKSGYTYGDRAFVELLHPAPVREDEHQFRAGKPVQVFSVQPEVKRPNCKGVVFYVSGRRMRIILNSRDLPDWLGLGGVGVDIQFDATTYEEMENALHRVIRAQGDRLAELRAISLGKKQPQRGPLPEIAADKELNPAQRAAVRYILASRDIALVHCPPGTGKTTTLVQAITAMSATEHNILVTAPSNTAVDVLTERLADQGLQVVRVGNISRVEESIWAHTLDVQLARHPESKHIKKLKVQAAEKRRAAGRYKRRFGKAEYLERKNLYREASELQAWARQLEDRLLDLILDQAQVVCCTLIGSVHPVLARRRFRTVFIDEAAQAREPATWVPISRASRVVLAGDPFQLPPTVRSARAQKGGLDVTLLERCLPRFGQAAFLNVQYRMHEHIMGFSNAWFYGDRLQADASVARHQLAGPAGGPLVFVDTAGCGFEEDEHPVYKSKSNRGEALILLEHLRQMREQLEEPAVRLAILTPYRQQVQLLDELVAEDPVLAGQNLTIRTVDGFQGQEADAVYISLVRSNGKGELGFLRDYRRMNVALTRARKLLVVVGDSATLGGDPFYQAFLSYCEEKAAYQTAWSYLQSGTP